ncbi:MAG TPA: c-type cytochrome [Anaerolineales bacterium]|nr:c-type cytochrome [Anaerolineales bacterium]HMV94923.1 c-type cytochrome [Anaerolineales bacterium]HNA54358.1 c-type cytochrome [Anaerolineales bacterium]HND91878.1 c-type cytochrome [Anaerolineales bacterium]HNE69884.1 c-type cytochrome [Anaerolineales bacterium]
MNEETKKKINARYEKELNKGERFWPDSIFKDLVVSLGIFILLVLLASFVGVAPEPKADPSDTSYIPRPEWYFLFLFKFLALYGQIPLLGKIEWLATVLVPGIAIGVLTLLPFIEKSPDRHYAKRALSISVMTIMVVGIILMTLMSEIPTVSADGSKLLGLLQAMAGLAVPGLAMIALFVAALAFKTTNTRFFIWTTSLTVVSMIILSGTVMALHTPPAVEETEVATTLVDQIFAGQDLYSVHCTECHGDDGSVAVIEGVEGLEGEKITPINSHDVLYTITDSAMYEVIAYGRPNAGMTPFGKAYGGELSKSEIDYIVTYMRYMWDDRFEIPAEALKPLFPPLAEGEVPSYEVHIQPIVKRYCVSCHRAGKENNNYLMTSYEEMLTTGDNAANNIIAGDENSYLLQVIQEHAITDANGQELIGVMPPNRALKPNIVDVFIRWIMNGMPQTAVDAAALFTAPAP